MKKVLMTVLVMLTFLQAGITFGTGSRVFIYNANISVYGNLKNLGGVITPISTSKFSFVGSAQDTLTNIYTFPNLVINKPAGNVRLNNSTNNFTLTGNVTLTQGNILTGTNTLELGSAATVTGETATKYVVGTVKAARAVGTGSNTFGGIGYSLGTGTGDLGTVTVYRYTGDGTEVSIYGTEGVWRKWTVETSNAFSGTRSVVSNWFSNEDNGNNLTALKVWKYEPVKSSDGDLDIRDLKKIKFDIENISVAKSKGVEESVNPEFVELLEEDAEFEPSENDGKNLYWVEVDGATFNTAASPRTATYTINGSTSYTICSASNAFADGAGTLANPYQIATLDQLNNVRNFLSAHFIQIADIDASATTGWNSNAGWIPITNFTGKYNGDGHTVSNLFISRTGTNYVGLFGYTTAGSEIKDLGLENLNITGGSYTGGLVGYSRGTVKNCYSKGVVKSSTGSYTGGFVGRTTTGNNIYDSYSYVNVSVLTGGTTTYAAGFCGYHGSGPISRCYSTGSVQLEGGANPTTKGFAGYSIGTVAGNFWNTETSGQTTTYGTSATGLTKTQMRTLLTFTNAAWDFQAESVNGTEDIWGINAVLNSGYPFLSWEGIKHRPSPFAGGIGTADEPFLVSNLTQLDSVRGFLSYDFNQTADIDASPTAGWDSNSGWSPIGTSTVPFTGDYDGQFYKISGITINRGSTNYQGFFGYINSALISNLSLENLTVAGSSYVGGICGRVITGTITDSYVKGSVTAGGNYSGGIVGYMSASSLVDGCYADILLRALNYSGGLVGRIETTSVLRNSYVKGSITRPAAQSGTYFGGVCGFNNATKILKCYSTAQIIYEMTTNPTNKGFTGVVSTGGDYEMADNYWDINTSGQTTTAGIATGKTTAEMKQQGTFVNWDFTTPVWNIHTSLNSGYPYLNWEYRLAVEAPSNLALTVSGSDVILTWNAVTNATGYAVYSSTDPYGTFSLNTSGVFNGTQWTAPLTGSRYFYYITALNATKNYPLVIQVNEIR